MIISNENKLMAAGYRFIRPREKYGKNGSIERLDIWVKTGEQDWSLLEKGFPSEEARNQRIQELLQEDKTLRHVSDAQEKLMAAGYRFIGGNPPNCTKLEIWGKSSEHDWSIMEPAFPSKAARERRIIELLENYKNLLA